MSEASLLDGETPKTSMKSKTLLITITISILALGIFLSVFFTWPSSSTNTLTEKTPLRKDNGCDVHPQPMCPSESGQMEDKWKDHLWNTPPRNQEGWKSGFQDMNVLVGYAKQTYSADHRECTVEIVTKCAHEKYSLTYYFDGFAQTLNTRTFKAPYKGPLNVIVLTDQHEKLELPEIDFLWNLQELPQRQGDYRNGQKGAIVELFGWPDEEIKSECKRIAEAGYLGVKLFPHQEQIMSMSPEESMMNPWYFMYQPVSYRLEGRAGNRSQLRETIRVCRSYGLRVYADAVVNHMTANGNDASKHRDTSCNYWGPKYTTAADESPFYTTGNTYETNQWTGKPNNALEFPAVPYGPMDFHCIKTMDKWADPNNLNTGWLVGLSDLDTSKDYVRQRIADFFIDLLSVGFSGFRIDAAKHIHPNDLAVIFKKFKAGLGGSIPADWFTWLEVLVGGEAWLLVQDSDYSFTTHFTQQLQQNGLSNDDIDKIKIWWAMYPTWNGCDEGRLSNWRKVIQNDDHDQQNEGSSSRSLGDRGCVLVKGCSPEQHRGYEVKLFESPYDVYDNDNEYPIRMVLSSYYYKNGILSVPDGKSLCSMCKEHCESCKDRPYAKASDEYSKAYEGQDWTRVHRDPNIISAMKKWMHIQ